ncbi:MAG: hypothetical protein ABI573_02270 [Chloroflexota bacterium]
MTRFGLGLVAFIVLGCAQVQPSVVTAADEPFPASFAEAGQWGAIELVPRPGTPRRFGSLEAALKDLDGDLRAGIKVPRPGSGVTITVPDGAVSAHEVHVFVTIIGGATDVSAGGQLRLVLRHDSNGWWLDPQGEGRTYCDRALSGFGHNSCR